VDKEVKWTAKCKDKSLVGTVKEVIKQISHSKKWPKVKGEKGLVNSYSLLQDHYFEHMRAAGFEDIERGERGSTKEHLEVLDYKIQQEKKHLAELEQQAVKTEQTLEKKTAQVEKLNKETAVKTKAAATIKEIDAMGHGLPLVPGVHFTDDEAAKLKALAKKSVNADDRIAATKKKMAAVEEQLAAVDVKLRDSQIEANHWHRELADLKNEVKDYLRLVKNFPAQVKELFDGLHHDEQAKQQQAERQHHKKSYDRGL
jgi:chromosome segregation ATPase